MATIGFTIPFTQTTGSLGLFTATTTDLAAAKEDLKNLLLTNWGERPMHYDMGCNFREFLFNQSVHGETEILVEERIRSQVAKWLPFLAINQVKTTLSDNTIHVDMSFVLISKPEAVQNLSVEVTA